MHDILTFAVFLPLVFMIVLGVLRVSINVLRVGSLVGSLIVLIMVLFLLFHFDPNGGVQFNIVKPWITSYGITYSIGVDSISMILLVLVSILMPLLFVSIWDEKRQGYFFNLLLLQTGVTGAIVSFDLILFYLFWETMLLPIFIMIGRYGYGMRQFNAMKIIIMTVLGSMSMLFSIMYLGYVYLQTHGFWSFALSDLGMLDFEPRTSIILAAGFLLAFAIKIPLIGFHTWMAPAYSSAPTPALVILSAIMAKLGVYGIWRFGFGLFESSLIYYEPIIIALSLVGVIFYAIHAIMEKDLKRMFAFSSGSHLSFIALGLFLTNIYSWSGSLYLVATHALASAGMFLMIGMIGKRLKTITIAELGGIANVAPRFAFLFSFFALSIAGVPGTGGFVAEILVIVGAFKYSFVVGVLTALTLVSSIMYIFWMLQRTIYGQLNGTTSNFEEITKSELAILAPLVILLLATGIFPSLFTPLFEPHLQMMLSKLGAML